MLVTSIFSFSHNVFYPIKDRNYHSCYIYSVVCKCFQFGRGKIFVVWDWVLIHLITACFKQYLLALSLIKSSFGNARIMEVMHWAKIKFTKITEGNNSKNTLKRCVYHAGMYNTHAFFSFKSREKRMLGCTT